MSDINHDFENYSSKAFIRNKHFANKECVSKGKKRVGIKTFVYSSDSESELF